jgi:hypothetical protein
MTYHVQNISGSLLCPRLSSWVYQGFIALIFSITVFCHTVTSYIEMIVPKMAQQASPAYKSKKWSMLFIQTSHLSVCLF